jgi:hypothetical protein
MSAARSDGEEMSKIDESKLIDAMVNIAEYFRAISELSLNAHNNMASIIKTFQTGEIQGSRSNAPTPEPDLENGDDKPIFPDTLANLVNVTPSGTVWIVKPTKFLGAENFAMIAHIVKEYGGRYNKSIGKGQSGYFETPRKVKP